MSKSTASFGFKSDPRHTSTSRPIRVQFLTKHEAFITSIISCYFQKNLLNMILYRFYQSFRHYIALGHQKRWSQFQAMQEAFITWSFYVSFRKIA